MSSLQLYTHLQGLSKIMTDLLSRYWSFSDNTMPGYKDISQSSAVEAETCGPAYSSIGLPNQTQPDQHMALLGIAFRTPITTHDWQYFGKHAMPLVIQTWVNEARRSIVEYQEGVNEGFPLPNMEFYVTALCKLPHIHFCSNMCISCYAL